MRDESSFLERWLTVGAWVPALLLAAGLGIVVAPLLPLPEPGSAPPGSARLDPARAKMMFALNLWLLSGNSLSLSWFITLRTLARTRPPTGGARTPLRAETAEVSLFGKIEPTDVGGHRFFTRLISAGFVTVGGGSLVTLFLATLADGEQSLAMSLFIYAPTLAVSYGLLGLAAARMMASWKVALAGAALWATILATQLAYLRPDGELPSEMMFALASLPILLAVAIWLVTWSTVPREAPAVAAR